jgi:L-amino acid N-acyltransferase YncA
MIKKFGYRPEVTIRQFQSDDFTSVKEIYQKGIDTKNATFETSAPDWIGWNKKFLQNPFLIAEINGRVTGWAALSAVSARPAYAGVCEVSVYVHSGCQGHGIGSDLLKQLIDQSEQNGIWTLQATIFPENMVSIKIHKNLGFREVGYREKIGKMDGKWRNTILLERRSQIAGK